MDTHAGLTLQQLGEKRTQYILWDYTIAGLKGYFLWQLAHGDEVSRTSGHRDSLWQSYNGNSVEFLNKIKEYDRLSQLEDDAKAHLDFLTGGENPEITMLFPALSTAMSESSTAQQIALKDWLELGDSIEIAMSINNNVMPYTNSIPITAFLQFDNDPGDGINNKPYWETQLKQHYSNIASKYTNNNEQTLGAILDKLIEQARIKRENAENALDNYLDYTVANDSNPLGIATIHQDNEALWKAAVKEYNEYGLPAIKDWDIEEAKTALNSNEVSKIEQAIKDYIPHIGDNPYREQTALTKAWTHYTTIKPRQVEKDINAALSEIKTLFGNIIKGHEAANTLETLSRQTWGSHRYDPREVLNDQWEQDKKLLNELMDMGTEMSALGMKYQLPRLQKTLANTQDQRYTQYMEIRNKEMELLKQDEHNRYTQWDNQMRAIKERGAME